jgi:hypothetical protein
MIDAPGICVSATICRFNVSGQRDPAAGVGSAFPGRVPRFTSWKLG